MNLLSLICAIGYGAYILYNSYLFNENGKIPDGHTDSINALKDVEDAEERKRQIYFSLESNLITKKEANKLY